MIPRYVAPLRSCLGPYASTRVDRLLQPGPVSCCPLQQESPVQFGAVTAPAFRYSVGNGTDTHVWTTF
jgi:hypothetical protein